MRAGVVVAAHPAVEDLAVRTEELGLHSTWVNDTPMVHGDPFVALSLCAKATRRIRLGQAACRPSDVPSRMAAKIEVAGPVDRLLVVDR